MEWALLAPISFCQQYLPKHSYYNSTASCWHFFFSSNCYLACVSVNKVGLSTWGQHNDSFPVSVKDTLCKCTCIHMYSGVRLH